MDFLAFEEREWNLSVPPDWNIWIVREYSLKTSRYIWIANNEHGFGLVPE
jgi:hypothetical protein